jgi:hypothetical protein
MNRQQLLARIETAWAAFNHAFAGLPEAALAEPGVTGDWSVKDLIAHVTIWEDEALTHLPHIIAGGTPPRYSVTYGGIDAFNAQMVERRRAISLAEVLQQMDDTHQRLIAFVETMPEDQFARETRARKRLRLDTYSHYPIHTRAILEWRDRRSAA